MSEKSSLVVIATVNQLNTQSPGPHTNEWRDINDLMDEEDEAFAICDLYLDEVSTAIASTLDDDMVSPYKKIVLARIVLSDARNFSPGTLCKTFALLNSLRPGPLAEVASELADDIAVIIGMDLEAEALRVCLWAEKVFAKQPPVLKPRKNAPKACWSCVMNRLVEFLQDEEVCAKRWYELDELVRQTPSLVLDEGEAVDRDIILDLGGPSASVRLRDYLLVDNANLLARHAFTAMVLLGAIRSPRLKKRVLLAKRFLTTSMIRNFCETAEAVEVATGVDHTALLETVYANTSLEKTWRSEKEIVC
ncbi:hypothetical protein SARC_00083 [Sphaeroforma arctica JP610]|uniref:Uncharacterized protein n=1 Tax=Sphaeroforma arctica JP610 TaxID=667725 RepID=A0A0L0GG68_9EUKA|nr:hypothetical protein SARC_00083 [Sphaeroforma arctica JP610]KNC87826.1 hypothetical protein SARC_00083 [Sphaeroforma arctica JP610]|eukprot:XP_014161728.1 hypothetical protein SARC_00083 [Sphaeroforma arctica JP610]